MKSYAPCMFNLNSTCTVTSAHYNPLTLFITCSLLKFVARLNIGIVLFNILHPVRPFGSNTVSISFDWNSSGVRFDVYQIGRFALSLPLIIWNIQSFSSPVKRVELKKSSQ